jgi:electron transfer flavoprotein alpha subunit
MPGTLWVVAEAGADGHLARISAEVATLVRGLGVAAARDVAGVVVAAPDVIAAGIAGELAAYLPRVVAVEAPAAATQPVAAIMAGAVSRLVAGDSDACVFVGASPDGRDVAGFLLAMLGQGVITNASAVTWDDGPVVEKGVFGGRLITTSELAAGHGIVTVALGSTAAEAAPSPGVVEMMGSSGGDGTAGVAALPVAPAVTVLERVAESAGAVQIEDAKVIIAGGRGLGSAEGFQVAEALAAELGGAVAASRAAVDAGWIPYARQVGQTGKIVKPDVYVALGISGAVQHKVGMQGAHTIVAVNTDPDAPIAEFADLFVIGNLFEVVPALIAELRARRT